MKLGSKLKSYILRGMGEDALVESLGYIDLTVQELKAPAANRNSLLAKLQNAREIDIMELWESFYGSIRSTCVEDADWRNTVGVISSGLEKARLGIQLTEAEVLSNAFQFLTQAKLFTTMQAVYELTPAGYEDLFETFSNVYKEFNHVIPSDSATVDFVPEGGDYPSKPLTDRYCKTKALKFGARIEMSRETLIADKTGQVVQQAEGLAESAKYREDELAAKAFQDSSNSSFVPDVNEQDAGSYFPEGTRCALYRTSAGSTKPNYELSINKKAQDLTNWDQIAFAIRLLRNMTNPRNSQIIEAVGNSITVVVPTGLEQRARMLTAFGGGALTVMNSNQSAGTESIETRAPDPIKQLGVQTVNVKVWNKLTTASTPSESTWYVTGLAKKMWKKHQRWPVEFNRASAAQLGGDDFKRDIILAVRGGFNAGMRAVDDKYTIQCTHS